MREMEIDSSFTYTEAYVQCSHGVEIRQKCFCNFKNGILFETINCSQIYDLNKV